MHKGNKIERSIPRQYNWKIPKVQQLCFGRTFSLKNLRSCCFMRKLAIIYLPSSAAILTGQRVFCLTWTWQTLNSLNEADWRSEHADFLILRWFFLSEVQRHLMSRPWAKAAGRRRPTQAFAPCLTVAPFPRGTPSAVGASEPSL